MLGINRRHSLATVVVVAGLLATAGPASAAGIKDGTSNTVTFGERAVAAPFILMADLGGQYY